MTEAQNESQMKRMDLITLINHASSRNPASRHRQLLLSLVLVCYFGYPSPWVIPTFQMYPVLFNHWLILWKIGAKETDAVADS